MSGMQAGVGGGFHYGGPTFPVRSTSAYGDVLASTPCHFTGKNPAIYARLLPVIVMLEKPGFQPLVEQTSCRVSTSVFYR